MTKGKLLKVIGTVASWFFAIFFLLIGLGAFLGSDPTSGILLLIMGGILLPPLARFVNHRHFGKIKAAIFVICFILFGALLEPPPNQVQPIASPSPSPTQEISEPASPSPTKQAPLAPSPSPKPSPSPRPKALAPSPSPTPKPKPVAPPPSPVEKAVETSPSPPPAPAVVESPQSNCDSSYPDSDVCIPPPPPDLNCPDISYRNFTVQQPDPHGFDRDSDGIGCEKN